jgi:hypothetical protein
MRSVKNLSLTRVCPITQCDVQLSDSSVVQSRRQLLCRNPPPRRCLFLPVYMPPARGEDRFGRVPVHPCTKS